MQGINALNSVNPVSHVNKSEIQDIFPNSGKSVENSETEKGNQAELKDFNPKVKDIPKAPSYVMVYKMAPGYTKISFQYDPSIQDIPRFT